MKQTAVNLSDRCLTPHETAVVAKGGKSAVTPRSVSVDNIIASVEAGIQDLPEEVAEDIGSETARILRRAKQP